jgi:NitT/TauT family transport system substrate-binding protein
MKTIIAIILTLFIISSCKKQELLEINIADASQPVFTLIYIAEHNNYFKEEGIKLNYKTFNSGKNALQSVISGESDLATVYETPVVIESMKGHKLGVLSTLHKSTQNTVLTVRKDAQIKDAKDLVGKKICVPFKTNGHFFLNQFLIHNELELDSVKLVNSPPLECVRKIENSEVDGVAVWSPHSYGIKRSLKENAHVFKSDIYTEVSVLAGFKTFISKNPLKVEKMLRALVKAQDFYLKNKKESLHITISALPNIEKEVIEGTWNSFSPIVVLDNVLLSILTNEANWFYERKIYTQSVPDFNKVLVPKYLYKVNSAFVTVDLGEE